MKKNTNLIVTAFAVVAFVLGLALGWVLHDSFGSPSPAITAPSVEAANGEGQPDAPMAPPEGQDSPQGQGQEQGVSQSQEATQNQPQGTGEDQSQGISSGRDGSKAEPGFSWSYVPDGTSVTRGQDYDDKYSVALYVHEYGQLPPNFISKTKARNAGWVASEGNLWDVLPGMSIGGSVWYNEERILPDDGSRTWHECDINYQGGYRGAERLVFSSDGLVFYTDDHYETFEQILFDD